jgi:Dolichyl-phosphate-mannose-protein mannosyltransferase
MIGIPFSPREKISEIRENCKKHPFISIIIPFLIFLLALIPRIIDLGTGVTIDEKLWIGRALLFIHAISQGDFIHTYLAIHPGVTTMWLSGLFMATFSRPGMDFPQVLSIARFPIALFTSLGILLMYFLLKDLFHEKIAILASVLIALDPFYLAHSRFIHVDALLTTFMTLSLLAFLLYIRKPDRKFFLIISGGFLGLALLTKQPAECLIPFFIVSLIILYLINSYQGTHSLKKTVTGCFSADFFTRIIKPFFIILCVAGLLFVLLWPAMWVAPVSTVQHLLYGLENVVKEPHVINVYFLGQVVSTGNLGPLFYPVVALMKVTPLTLIFSVFCLVFVFCTFRNTKLSALNLTIVLFVLFILFFYVLMTIGDKKNEEYILPVFPVIDILAAIGICFCSSFITARLGKISKKLLVVDVEPWKNRFFGMAIILIIILQTALLVPIAPYFLSYSNPIVLGGPHYSQEYIPVGWGEGLDLAAAYLNNKTGAEHLRVFEQYPGFREYSKEILAGAHPDSADYIVFYIHNIQLNNNDYVWDLYKNKTPEKIIVINNIDYCWIYSTHPQ